MHKFTLSTHYSHNFLTHLDARVKLVFTLILLSMVISSQTAVFPLIIAIMCAGLCHGMRVPVRILALRFVEPLYIGIMILVLKLFTVGTVPLFSFHFICFDIIGYEDGLLTGLRIASRIAGAVTVVAVVGFATPFTELMAALAWFKVPKGFIEISLFAWRYLFMLFDDAFVIYSAQRNRLGYAGYRRGLSSFGTLAGSLFIKAFDNSHNISTAMVQRGYDGTMMMSKHKPFRFAEVAFSMSVLTGLGILWNISA